MNQIQTLNRLDKAYADLCAAIEWAYQAQEWPLVMDLVWELSEYFYDRGRWKEQRRYLEYAVEAAQKSEDVRRLAQFQYSLGVIVYEQGDYENAETLYRDAINVFNKLGMLDAKADTLTQLGILERHRGRYNLSFSYFEQALKIWEESLGPDNPRIARVYTNLGDVLQELGDLDRARTAFEQALRIDEIAFGPDHPDVARDIPGNVRVIRAKCNFIYA